MKKIILVGVIIVILVILGFIIFKQIKKSAQTPPPVTSDTFNLILDKSTYRGPGGKLIIFRQNNTYTYTRYLEEDSLPTATAKLKFSDDELADIKQKIIDLKLLEIDDPFLSHGGNGDTCGNLYLKIQIGLDENELSWDHCNGEPDARLGEFAVYIYQILRSKEEFKELLAPPVNPLTTTLQTPLPVTPDTFNLILGSGLFSTLQNRLIIFRQNNTYIYTRYIGEYSQPTATAKLKFSDDELAGIKQKIIDLKLLNISNPVPNPGYYGSAGQVVGPCSNFYLKIQIGLDENELSFDDCNGAPDGRFGEFSNYIYQILQSKKEFMELPTPRLLYR